MTEEIIDKETGAIIFKKSKDTKNIEYLLKKIAELESRIEQLENKQENIKKEDS